MRARLLVAIVTSLPLASVALAAGQDPSPRPLIGAVEVVSDKVFDEPSSGVVTFYRVANKIHIGTHERVIRRELLFAPGERLDYERLEQTERNLRALEFLRDARIEVVPHEDREDGVARVTVRVLTWDAWSLTPRIDFEQVDDRAIWEVGVTESNLLGLGKSVTVARRTGLDRTSEQVWYYDPQLAGSRFTLTASAANLSDGDDELVALTRPYFSLEDPWAFSVRGGTFSRNDRLFADGREIDQLRHRGQWGDLEYGRAVRRRSTSALRLHAAYRVRDDRIDSERRDFGIVEVGIRSIEHRFARLTHVNRFERTEDFNLGAQSYATVGLSTPAFGGGENRVVTLTTGHARGIGFGPGHFLVADVGVAGRHERDRWLNTRAVARARYLRKHATRHLLIGRAGFLWGHELDPEVQLLLGAESGLRGYPVRQFAGTRSMLVSAEERWFIADDVWQVLSLGAAAFIDSGFAWPEDAGLSLADLRTAVGVGLLIGSNRLLLTSGGVRLDVGYALSPIPGVRRWVFSVGSDIEF
jgi:hemolysin activation/secretion protein